MKCRLFGHLWAKPDTSSSWAVTAINGKPVFACQRCGLEWFPLTWCRTKLTKRDSWSDVARRSFNLEMDNTCPSVNYVDTGSIAMDSAVAE